MFETLPLIMGRCLANTDKDKEVNNQRYNDAYDLYMYLLNISISLITRDHKINKIQTTLEEVPMFTVLEALENTSIKKKKEKMSGY